MNIRMSNSVGTLKNNFCYGVGIYELVIVQNLDGSTPSTVVR